MDAVKQVNVAEQLKAVSAQLATLTEQVGYIAKKQKERDELFEEMQPILKEVMSFATDKLQSADERGYFTFAKESGRVFDRIVESYGEDDVRALGDNIVRIMDTVRSMTQPHMLAIANDATEAIDKADELEPTGVFGMVRASRDEDVQRGMAVFLAVLRAVGRGVKEMNTDEAKPKKKKRPQLPYATPSSDRAGNVVPIAAKKAAKKKKKKVVPAPAPADIAPVMLDGVAFDHNGYLADPQQWTPDLAAAIASSQGVPALSERHWAAINAARNDFLETGSAPNIRRLTTISDVTTKELYKLFPKAPGMTVARVAGIPKPVGCI